jgi:tRNA(fMet)-specific endonuclease VapC
MAVMNNPGDMDMIVAATALFYNMIVVTNNDRHFSKISGLKTEHWTI